MNINGILITVSLENMVLFSIGLMLLLFVGTRVLINLVEKYSALRKPCVNCKLKSYDVQYVNSYVSKGIETIKYSRTCRNCGHVDYIKVENKYH